MSHIILGISSGIAAYKILELAKILKNKKHEVDIIMTSSASHIVSPEELEKITGNKVFIQLFDPDFSKEKILETRKVDHIEVAKKADIFVIAPATANTIAKLANGIADDFLTTSILATHAPILVCPSMNDVMWTHPTVQNNLQKLESYGYQVMQPEAGDLACGTEGIGRLPEITKIDAAIKEILITKNSLKGQKIVVTAGGTKEPIDSARIITNRSSGKMGIALAEGAFKRGADVLLIQSKTSQKTFLPIKTVTFETSSDLQKILKHEIPYYDVIFHAAAVSDFTIEQVDSKIDSDQPITLELKPTTKIINHIKKWNPDIKLIGFKATDGIDENQLKKVEKKLAATNADYFIINDISRKDIGFESDENEVIILDKKDNKKMIKKASKKEIARKILEIL